MFPQTYHVECVAVLSIPEGGKPARSTAAKLVLASASPRRRDLLAGLGLEFQVLPSDIPEDSLPGESPQDLVRRLSLEKALAVVQRVTEGYVIAADSTVVLEGQSLAKPEDAGDARRMLRALRGTEHNVTTGVTVVEVASGRRRTEVMTCPVAMRDFTDEEMEASIAAGTPMDKAGAYAIQDQEFRPARLLSGCYTNVLGLPLCRVVAMLEELGCPLPPRATMPAPAGCGGDCPLAPRSTQ
jgi:MAF protein